MYDSKFIDEKLENSTENQSASNANIASIETRLQILEDKVSALNKTNMEVIAADETTSVSVNDSTKDYVVSGNIAQTVSVVSKSAELKNISVIMDSNATYTNGNAISINNMGDTEFKSGSVETHKDTSSNAVKVQNSEYIVFKDMTFTGETYNTIMTGQNSTQFVKNMLIDNCNFNEDCKHINIWFGGFNDNAVLTISNCHFKTSEQFLCISDFAGANNKLTVNIINCTIDSYDNAYSNKYGYNYAGFMFIESRNIGNYETFVEANPFGNNKVSINIENLVVKGEKVTTENFVIANGQENQSMYFYHAQSGTPGCIYYNEETKNLFPTITIK